MIDVKPIETKYKEYRFRSRLEARWAVFFDILDIKYLYEDEGYDLGWVYNNYGEDKYYLGYYLPDFYLPKLNYFVEIKGKDATLLENLKCEKLSNINDVFLFDKGINSNYIDGGFKPYGSYFSEGKFRDELMQFAKCDKCGSIDITYSGWVHYSNKCKCYNDNHRNKDGGDNIDIIEAYTIANSYRF